MWNQALEFYSGYDFKQLEPVIERLCVLIMLTFHCFKGREEEVCFKPLLQHQCNTAAEVRLRQHAGKERSAQLRPPTIPGGDILSCFNNFQDLQVCDSNCIICPVYAIHLFYMYS